MKLNSTQLQPCVDVDLIARHATDPQIWQLPCRLLVILPIRRYGKSPMTGISTPYAPRQQTPGNLLRRMLQPGLKWFASGHAGRRRQGASYGDLVRRGCQVFCLVDRCACVPRAQPRRRVSEIGMFTAAVNQPSLTTHSGTVSPPSHHAAAFWGSKSRKE